MVVAYFLTLVLADTQHEEEELDLVTPMVVVSRQYVWGMIVVRLQN